MLKLRKPDVCVACDAGLPAGTLAWWDAEERTVTCKPSREKTPDPKPAESARPELDRGQAGASVHREYERRKHNREARIRKKHKWVGGLLLRFGGTPQSVKAFDQGGAGEQLVAEFLEKCAVNSLILILHDRRMPGGWGNIDHLAVAPTGVWVIDANNYKGKVRVQTPLLGKPKLRVSGRDRTKLIDGLDRQVAAVRDVLDRDGHSEVPVQGVLCFTSGDLPLLGTLKMRGHLLLYRKGLGRRLRKKGPISPETIDAIARALAAALPPA
jgi:hypothetical protein